LNPRVPTVKVRLEREVTSICSSDAVPRSRTQVHLPVPPVGQPVDAAIEMDVDALVIPEVIVVATAAPTHSVRA
jgi:hypothetical protein